MRLAVYTALCGPKSRVQKPLWLREGIDYICFTDQPAISIPAPWQVRNIQAPNTQIPKVQDPNRIAKRYKVLPHLFLPEYPASIWVDANFKVTRGFDELAWELLACPVVLFKHFERDCIYDEANVCKAMGLDDPAVIDAQMARYRLRHFPEHYGLGECGTLLRRHQTEKCQTLMERWWQEICEGSRRDQLSFMYAAWAIGYREQVRILPRTARDGWHHEWTPHLK
jgi:hypothetical protein